MEKDTPMIDGAQGKGYKDGEADFGAEDAADGKKKSMSQKTADYNKKEIHMLHNSWLSISEDPICGDGQRSYWVLAPNNRPEISAGTANNTPLPRSRCGAFLVATTIAKVAEVVWGRRHNVDLGPS
jgi:hypothetical protein